MHKKQAIRRVLWVSIGTISLALGWGFWQLHRDRPKTGPPATESVSSYTQPDFPVDSTSRRDGAKESRLIYPYSVIPGGVRDLAEFKQVLRRDRVVAAHFADFDISRVRFEGLPTEKAVYVSYRIKDEVFWTKRKLRLRAGEKVITDGVNYARARCANRISELPRPKISPHEPSPAELETQLVAAQRPPGQSPTGFGPSGYPTDPPVFPFIPTTGSPLPLLTPPESWSPGPSPWDPPMPPIFGGPTEPQKKPTSETPSSPPTSPGVVPEPGTWLLVATGASYFVVRAWRRRTPPSA